VRHFWHNYLYHRRQQTVWYYKTVTQPKCGEEAQISIDSLKDVHRWNHLKINGPTSCIVNHTKYLGLIFDKNIIRRIRRNSYLNYRQNSQTDRGGGGPKKQLSEVGSIPRVILCLSFVFRVKRRMLSDGGPWTDGTWRYGKANSY